jgi:hypothetical protein
LRNMVLGLQFLLLRLVNQFLDLLALDFHE